MTAKRLSEDQILAYTLLGEAGGESKDGQAAVIHVILNRARASGRSARAEALRGNNKTGKHAFSTWNNAVGLKSKYATSSAAFQAALALVQAVKAGTIPDPTGGATHYYANTGANAIDAPYWWEKESSLGQPIQIGNHIFAARGPVTSVAPVPAVAGDSIKTQRALVAAERVLGDQSVKVAPGSPTPATGGAGLKTARALYSVGQVLKAAPSLADLPATKAQLAAVIGRRVNTAAVIKAQEGKNADSNNSPQRDSGLITRPVNTVKVDAFGQPMEDVQPVGQTTVAGRPDAPAGTKAGGLPGKPVTSVGIETGAYHLPKIDLGMTPHKAVAQVSAAQQILNSIADAKANQSKIERNVTTVVEHKSGVSVVVPKAGSVAMPANAKPLSVMSPVERAQEIKNRDDVYTTKTVMVKKTVQVKNPEWGKVNPVAVNKLQDIHDKNDDATAARLAADQANIPEFITQEILVPKVERILVKPKQAAVAPVVPVVQAVQQSLIRKDGFVFTQNADGSLTPTDAAAAAMRRQALTGGDGMDRSAAGDNFSGERNVDTSQNQWGLAGPANAHLQALFDATHNSDGTEIVKSRDWGRNPPAPVTPPRTGGPMIRRRV